MGKISLIPLESLKAVDQANTPKITAYCNNDQVIVAWKYDNPIIDCVGFAVYRKLNNETDAEADAIMNRVGFEDEAYEKGEQRPSSEWPIQRFVWTDFTVGEGDVASYMVVPILFDGEKLIKNSKNASSWTKKISISTGMDENGERSPYSVYFNRGIISSQFFSRMRTRLAAELPGEKLKDIIDGDNNKLRDFLGGFLDNRLFSLLDEITGDTNLTVYAALYELHQKDVLNKLGSIGNRAFVILANGAAKSKGEDKNAGPRNELKAKGVNVWDRIVDVTKKHFAHNKFLVICESGIPKKVWTGSTNWTSGGMFSQVNNAILIDDEQLASIYLEEWKALKEDVEIYSNNYGNHLYNKNIKSFGFGQGNSRVWFTPTKNFSDLRDVEKLMENAKSGILFLMFNPGPKNTFFSYIQNLQERKKNLFIHGIINQDPGATTHNQLILFHKGQKVETDWNAILPKAIGEEFSFWSKEVSGGMVTIHSKVLVIDPFGDSPYVITGSHNFGPKASATNDENLLIINDRKVAEQYAVNIMAVYDHYRWRYSLYNKNSDYRGLSKDREWMSDYMSGQTRMKELDFWL